MRIAVTFLTLLCLLGIICSARAETKLMVVSDLHYLEPSLYEGSDLFIQTLRNGDGKITQYGEELLAALYRQIGQEQPDALIVTGDLTFNGEQKSHAALADWFRRVEESGVPVWIIPGNHDINVEHPTGYAKGTVYGTKAATPEDFLSVYSDFLETGGPGFSYVAKVSSSLWVAMTDVARYQDRATSVGMFTAQHASWLENVLIQAGKENARVVTATHHNVLAHTSFSRNDFLMFGSERMAALARQYGVQINLSGHLHIQHIVRENGLTDAALGAFCIWPHRYALLTFGDDDCWSYDAKELNEKFLPDGFQRLSREWFTGISRDKMKASGITGSDEETDAMADYAARFHAAYFSGTYRKDDRSWTRDPAYALWESRQDGSFVTYLRLMMSEASDDPLHAEGALSP